MQSRLDKYKTNEKNRYERTRKNTKLYEKVYDDIYSNTTYKNMSIIDTAKEIDINKLKNILNDKYDTRQYRTLKNYSKEDISLNDISNINVERQETHDINKIIDDAKSKRAFIDEAREKQKYYEYDKRNTKYDDDYKDLENEEKELEELINTMVITKEKTDNNVDDELLSDLIGNENTIVTNPIETNLENIKEELIDTSTISKNTSKVDKTFYTDSNMFTKNDFEDFSTLSKELNSKHKPLKVIIIIVMIILIIVIGYFVFTKYFAK